MTPCLAGQNPLPAASPPGHRTWRRPAGGIGAHIKRLCELGEPTVFCGPARAGDRDGRSVAERRARVALLVADSVTWLPRRLTTLAPGRRFRDGHWCCGGAA